MTVGSMTNISLKMSVSGWQVCVCVCVCHVCASVNVRARAREPRHGRLYIVDGAFVLLRAISTISENGHMPRPTCLLLFRIPTIYVSGTVYSRKPHSSCW